MPSLPLFFIFFTFLFFPTSWITGGLHCRDAPYTNIILKHNARTHTSLSGYRNPVVVRMARHMLEPYTARCTCHTQHRARHILLHSTQHTMHATHNNSNNQQHTTMRMRGRGDRQRRGLPEAGGREFSLQNLKRYLCAGRRTVVGNVDVTASHPHLITG